MRSIVLLLVILLPRHPELVFTLIGNPRCIMIRSTPTSGKLISQSHQHPHRHQVAVLIQPDFSYCNPSGPCLSYSPDNLSQYVLEISVGLSSDNGIAVGTQVKFDLADVLGPPTTGIQFNAADIAHTNSMKLDSDVKNLVILIHDTRLVTEGSFLLMLPS